MSRFYLRAIIACFALAPFVAGLSPASAQDRRQNEPGQFDFYLLTLSWSPSFCDASAERGAQNNRNGDARGDQAASNAASSDQGATAEKTSDQPRRNSRRNAICAPSRCRR